MDFAINIVLNKFNNFSGIDGESTKQLIERYSHLVLEMRRLDIKKTNKEWIDKLCDALPYDEWGTYLMMLKNKTDFIFYSLSDFIEKIKERELEIQKIRNEAKLKSEKIDQDVKEQVKEISAIKVEKKAEAILEDERDIFGKDNTEKQIAINSHLAKIIQLEKEAEMIGLKLLS
ncbi:uncharacterized protein LOC118482631 [Helianthus annuus]|uniref:uncharacterized protein LOC118482631 n=1 Tax=Helianthus annuus TaxID=4232 RepID=UPI0016530405|nr:uncharacterized protein LOC118482631 [Helianthus annuus]